MCGYRFDLGEQAVCQHCPLNKGCGLVCCPACGYQTVDIGASKLASFAQTRFFPKRSRRQARARHRNGCLTLADVPPGFRARVVGFLDSFPADRRAYLQAYGMAKNDWVTVVQHSPVTVIRLEHTELALESELAGGIQVQQISLPGVSEEKPGLAFPVPGMRRDRSGNG